MPGRTTLARPDLRQLKNTACQRQKGCTGGVADGLVQWIIRYAVLTSGARALDRCSPAGPPSARENGRRLGITFVFHVP